MKYYILTLKVIRLSGPPQETDRDMKIFTSPVPPQKPRRLVPELSK